MVYARSCFCYCGIPTIASREPRASTRATPLGLSLPASVTCAVTRTQRGVTAKIQIVPNWRAYRTVATFTSILRWPLSLKVTLRGVVRRVNPMLRESLKCALAPDDARDSRAGQRAEPLGATCAGCAVRSAQAVGDDATRAEQEPCS